VRDSKMLTLQANRAREVVAGQKTARTPRFVRTANGSRSLDEAALARARRLTGLKGYVTNINAEVMPAGEVIANYHDLWHVEQSFRMWQVLGLAQQQDQPQHLGRSSSRSDTLGSCPTADFRWSSAALPRVLAPHTVRGPRRRFDLTSAIWLSA
jgi:hypothetical protein